MTPRRTDAPNRDVQELPDAQAHTRGITASNVAIQHVEVNASMIRAIAQQAEAGRDRRAKVIDAQGEAQGEAQAALKLLKAAPLMSRDPGAMQLRCLGALGIIAAVRNATIIFPGPMEIPASDASSKPEKP